ncbi:MAG: ribonuclease H-like domain-containing protein [Chloroflexota bacterium]|nr:ribonuclease H-like domain-containing protein [Chloroflexota bacterium]
MTRSAAIDATAARAERMRAAVAAHAAAMRGALPSRPACDGLPPIDRILGGAWLETEHGRAFVRDAWFAPGHLHGTVALGAALALPRHALEAVLGRPFNPPPSALQCRDTGASPPPHLAFFDIETTGLSGGTGTYAFLAGLGSFEDGGFRLRQYFLPAVDGERAMLALLAADLARCDALVTYNGRAFDLPVVETRMTLARLRPACAEMPHLDLLHAVRRLYRHRLQSCRLADAERRLLRVERFDDVPGAHIPALYFDYVRAGRAAPLRAVFRHNAEDVLSLVGVLVHLGRLFSDDQPAPDDAVALARWWELAGAPGRALALYRQALPWIEGSDDWSWAAHRHAHLSRRAGSHDEAAALWRALWQQGDAAAGLALAKHLEHRVRDYPAAEQVVAALRTASPDAARPELQARLARIRRKRARLPTQARPPRTG